MRSLIALILVATSLIACSDFLNDKKSKSEGSGPRGTNEKTNPFEPDFNPNAGEFKPAKMLANIGLNVIAPQTKNLRLQTELLDDDVKALCKSLDNGQEAPILEERVKAQWTNAMLVYHSLDAVPVGPINANGRFLRDNIYSWPTVNYCGIDLAVVNLSETRTPNTKLLYTAKGFAAVEYLLFETQLGSQCNPRNSSHAKAFEWVKKPALDKKRDRCHFARQLTQDLFKLTRTLERAWDPEGSNYAKDLHDATGYESGDKAVNAVSDALFTLEDLKDFRLGRPLGLHKDCLNQNGKCADLVEHSWSGLSLRAVKAQLKGFREVFLGSSDAQTYAFGFDDYLISIGRRDVSQHMIENLERAIDTSISAEGYGPLSAQIESMDTAQCANSNSENRLVEACSLHYEVRQVALKLKSEFLTALSLEAPPTHQGDND